MYKYICSKIIIFLLYTICIALSVCAEMKNNIKKNLLEDKKTNEKNILTTLYGIPSSNSLNLGALAYHMRGGEYKYYYPYVGLTVSNISLSYFRNSFNRDTYGFGIERTWFSQHLNNDFNFNVNYNVGILARGYCFNGLSCKTKSFPIIPVI